MRRLAAMVDPALSVLSKSMKSKAERIALDAARDILDRNGLKGKQEIEVSGDIAVHDARDRLIERLVAVAAPRTDQGGG